MADATVAMNVNSYPTGIDTTLNRTIIYGTATITANAGTGPSTGLPLNWATMGDGNFNNGQNFVLPVGPLQTKPQFVIFQGNGTESTAEQLYSYDYTNDSLLVWRAGAFVTSGIVADTVNFKAEFIKNAF
jgi:hypothetical protein